MEKIKYFSCLNLANCFANALTFGDDVYATSLFSEDAVLELPQKGKTVSKDGLSQFFKKLYSEIPAIYLVNSPQINIGDFRSSGSFFVDVIYLNPDSKTTALGGSRFDMIFCMQNGMPRIQKCVWYDMLKLHPEPYKYDRMKTFFKPFQIITETCLSDEVCFELTQILCAESHYKVKETPLTLSLIFNMAFEQQDNVIHVFYMTLDLCADISGEMIMPSISSHRIHFTYLDSGWERESAYNCQMIQLCELKDTSMNPSQAAVMLKQNLDHPLPVSICKPDWKDVAIIQNKAAEWVSAIRTGNARVFYDTCLLKDASDLMVHVNRPVHGIEGFLEQCRIMIEMDKKQPKKQGNHILSTPLLHLETEKEIVALWLDFGWTMLAGAFGITENPNPVLPAIGRYIMKFRKKENGWKIFYLQWGPLAQVGKWYFSRELSGGWASTLVMKRWPSLQESYEGYDDKEINEYLVNPMEEFL